MPKVQVRDVSDATHAMLKRRAAAAGQSLQEYLRALLEDHAATPTVLKSWSGRPSVRVDSDGR